MSDITPPGDVLLRADGSFNLASAFTCVEVSNVEVGASVYYELTTDGAAPADPTSVSPKMDASGKICGIDQNGTTRIRVRQVDAAGNLGPSSLHRYTLDTAPPVICGVSATPDGVAYVDLPLHLRLSAEKDGTATIDVQGVGTVTLRDDGASGDAHAGDGIYELDYAVPPGSDVPNATLTAHFKDAAGNPAADLPFAKKVFVDRSATPVAGAFVDSTVWTAAGSPYVITATSAFEADLSLEPGVVVIFKGAAQLSALKNFTALGTQAQPIVMYGANLRLDGPKLLQTFDVATGAYVAGPRLDYVQMSDGRLSFGYVGFNEAGAYITNSAIGSLSGESVANRMFGVYVRHSWIGTIPEYGALLNGRITDSYLDNVVVDGYTENAELTYNQISKLEVDRWHPTFTLAHCNVTEMTMHRPTQATNAAFHQNNLGGANVTTALSVTSGNPAEPQVDASANYWGSATTAQMTTLGSSANIGAIFDFFDDTTQTRVDYKNWLSTPANAGPSWVRSEAPAIADSCASGGSGGAGGSGSGGTGGSGGAAVSQLLGACNNVAGKFCEEVSGPIALQSSVQDSCTSNWQSSCASSNLIGTCTFVHGAASLGLTGVIRYYQGGLATAEQLKNGCESGLAGTWLGN